MPECIILAGVNGAGKSTLYRSLLSSDKNYALINADEILQSMHGDWHSNLDNLKAMRAAVAKLKHELLSGHNVIQETTLASSRKGILKFINFAKKQGYTVRLEYVGLASAELAVSRVQSRVSKGGHGVSSDLVTRRYTRSLQRLAELYDEFDAVELWDNSLSDTELIYSADHGKVLINKSKDYNWVPDSIKEKHS